ncbi:class I SAM-dependent methyltransferase [Bacillus songklensis]|uniref:Class I SAM-dependent methyltransferase n=1 Tax=Bacillus songklensis TaxID=1069116 RepID=A0ABV8AZB2_9BACI
MDFQYMDMLALLGVGGAHPGGLHLTKQLLEEEKITNATNILDIGCGTGQTAAYITWDYNCSVTACDLNETMVEKANQRFERMDFPFRAKIENVEQLSFADKTFDFVLLESVAAFTDVSLSLTECCRVLKKNGVLLAVEMVKDPKLSQEDEEVIKRFYNFRSVMTESQWMEQLTKAGFSHITIVNGLDMGGEEHNLDFGIEFDLSPNINPSVFELLDEHERLTEQFRDLLGFRVFRCIR